MRKLKPLLAILMALTMVFTLAGTAVAGRDEEQAETASSFPAKYDARKDNIVTPVKDQSPYGNCWAHATISCLETDAIKNLSYDVNTTDFSENHLSYWVNGASDDGIGDYYIRSKFMVYYGTYDGLKDDNINEYHVILNDTEELVYSVMFSTKETGSEATPSEATPADVAPADPATDSEPEESKLYRVISLFEGKSDEASPDDYEVISEYEITADEIDNIPYIQLICMTDNESGNHVNSLYVMIAENGIRDCVLLIEDIPANSIYAEDNIVYLYDEASKRFIPLGEILQMDLETVFYNYRTDDYVTIPKSFLDRDGFIANSCVSGNVYLFFIDENYVSVDVLENVFMDGYGLENTGGGNWDMASATLATFTGIAKEKENYILNRYDTDSGLILNKSEYLGGVADTIDKIALNVISKYRDKYSIIGNDDFDIFNLDSAQDVVLIVLTGNYDETKLSDLDSELIKEVETYFRNESDNVRNKVKRWVLDHGGARMALNASYEYLNNEKSSFYCNNYIHTNHEVMVVGWDDSYSKKNFTEKPEGDGAWLIKNSWGTEGEGTGDKGYFWVSYYDKSLEFIGYSAEKDEYEGVYSYTGVVGQGSMVMNEQAYRGGISNNDLTIANVYELDKGERVSSIGALTYGGENIGARIRIYKYDFNKNTNAITSGEALVDEIHIIENPGYHTFRLDDIFEIKEAGKYVFAVTYSGSTKENPLIIPTEEPYNGAFENAEWLGVFNHTEGQSYYRYTGDLTGAQWIDSDDTYGNFYINVLTVDKGFKFNDVKVDIKDYSTIKTVKYGEKVMFIAEAENVPGVAEIHWFVDDENDPVIGFKEVGTGEKYIINSAEDSVLIQAKIINSKGTVLAESTVEELDISLNFIARIKVFFKTLFAKIKEFCEKILEKLPIKLNLDIKIKAD